MAVMGARLPIALIMQVRREYVSGDGVVTLAARHDLSRNTISKIINGQYPALQLASVSRGNGRHRVR